MNLILEYIAIGNALLSTQQRWGTGRRSCPPPFGLPLDLTLAHTPALPLRTGVLATARRKARAKVVVHGNQPYLSGLVDGVSVRRYCSRLPQKARLNLSVNEKAQATLK